MKNEASRSVEISGDDNIVYNSAIFSKFNYR